MEHFDDTDDGRIAMCEKLERYCGEREKDVRIKSEKKGEAETRIENAEKMIASGRLSYEDISICSGLPLSEVKELAG